MKVLLLTFYFSPDLSAGSFRSQALASALLEKLPDHSSLDVITTLPNRYASFSASAAEHEKSENLTVHRIPLPSHKSGMLDQSWAFLRYARRVLRQTDGNEYDLVIATSSRLMTAVLGAWVAKRCRTKLYLDIRDIFIENLPFLLPRGLQWLGIRFFGALERWAITRASIVNLASPGFDGYFSPRYPSQKFTWHTNGVDPVFSDRDASAFSNRSALVSSHSISSSSGAKKRLKVLYAGNIGMGQGLDRILPGVAKRLEGQADFIVIGDGGQRTLLEKSLRENGVKNVDIRAPMHREQLLGEYHEADILFLHLNNMSCFERVIPSKLFEYAATGKPIWAGVRAFTARFCQENITNIAVFEPCDVDSALKEFDQLSLEEQSRNDFVESYRRDSIMKRMADDVVSLLQ
ncbi:glycosyltransferase family 4 protein [Halomonas elongata]|uniref:glycosyltransferase family 4 protein n=1 Tax=Halomonas elongata TaxID=2746 RepID=UPI00186B6ED6|nr:glycosyltransferase family 4 protein [Halomonas elongata]MBW5799443.1 glycosyltransferase family 4 protein [Halomonas elongata]